jgi:hypothetical protein
VIHWPAPTRGALRLLRGGLLAGCSAVLAVAAHAAGGGGAPDTGLAVLLTLLIAAAGTALADRRRGGTAIVAALGVSHTGEHLILTTLADHHHHSQVNGVAMTCAHVVAVLVTALLLAGAESALFRAAAALGMLLPRKPFTVPPLPVGAPGLGRYLVVPARTEKSVLLGRIIRRRGPPVRT